MRLKFFWIPAVDSGAAEQEVNQFLAMHRVVHLEKTFCASGPQAAGWALCVEWLPGATDAAVEKPGLPSGKIDYREVLDAPTFRLYAALRSWRKGVATAQGVPIYTVATNEQLAAIARQRIQTPAELEKVEGWGAARMGKYAAEVLAVCRREIATPEVSGEKPA
jgi:superfamily II DNA helicase RecQ